MERCPDIKQTARRFQRRTSPDFTLASRVVNKFRFIHVLLPALEHKKSTTSALCFRRGLHEAEQARGSRPLVPGVPEGQTRPHPGTPHLRQAAVPHSKSNTVPIKLFPFPEPSGRTPPWEGPAQGFFLRSSNTWTQPSSAPDALYSETKKTNLHASNPPTSSKRNRPTVTTAVLAAESGSDFGGGSGLSNPSREAPLPRPRAKTSKLPIVRFLFRKFSPSFL